MLTKNLRVFGHKVPLYPLFMVSGALCDVFQALIDYFISTIYTFEFAKTTVCWTLSYTLSIILRHSSHRLLVFGDYEGTYCMSLTRTYMAYSTAIVISMFANHQLVAFFGLPHREAWILTMLFTGIYNFFVLKASWKVINRAQGIPEPGSGSGVGISTKPLLRDRSLSLAEGGGSSSSSGGSGTDGSSSTGAGVAHRGNRERTVSANIGGSSNTTGGPEAAAGGNRRRSSSMRVGFETDLVMGTPDGGDRLAGTGGVGKDGRTPYKEKDSMADLSSAAL